MTSRERVLTACGHKSGPLAVDFGGLHTSLHHKAYRNVMTALDHSEPQPDIQDYFQMIVYPDTHLLDLFGSDCLPVYAQPAEGSEDITFSEDEKNYFFSNEWGITFRRPKDGYFFDLHKHPLTEARDLDDVKKYDWPDPEDPGRIKNLRKKVTELREGTDKALILFNQTGGTHEHSYFLRGLDQLLMDLIINPDIADYLAAEVSEWSSAYFTFLLNEIGDLIDIVQVGDDLGTTNGLIFSRDHYLKYYKKREQALIGSIKKIFDGPVYFHSCGSIGEIIPDLIEIGVDILNPVQIQAKNMDSAYLKKEFGRDLTFWGGRL